MEKIKFQIAIAFLSLSFLSGVLIIISSVFDILEGVSYFFDGNRVPWLFAAFAIAGTYLLVHSNPGEKK